MIPVDQGEGEKTISDNTYGLGSNKNMYECADEPKQISM